MINYHPGSGWQNFSRFVILQGQGSGLGTFGLPVLNSDKVSDKTMRSCHSAEKDNMNMNLDLAECAWLSAPYLPLQGPCS